MKKDKNKIRNLNENQYRKYVVRLPLNIFKLNTNNTQIILQNPPMEFSNSMDRNC